DRPGVAVLHDRVEERRRADVAAAAEVAEDAAPVGTADRKPGIPDIAADVPPVRIHRAGAAAHARRAADRRALAALVAGRATRIAAREPHDDSRIEGPVEVGRQRPGVAIGRLAAALERDLARARAILVELRCEADADLEAFDARREIGDRVRARHAGQAFVGT